MVPSEDEDDDDGGCGGLVLELPPSTPSGGVRGRPDPRSRDLDLRSRLRTRPDGSLREPRSEA